MLTDYEISLPKADDELPREDESLSQNTSVVATSVMPAVSSAAVQALLPLPDQFLATPASLGTLTTASSATSQMPLQGSDQTVVPKVAAGVL